MRVLHFNALDRGGAAVSATRLHKGLLDIGVNSKLVFAKGSGKVVPASEVLTHVPRAWYHPIRNVPLLRRLFFEKHVVKPKDVDWISYPKTDFQFEKSPAFSECDIIHLHWISGFINYPTFFKSINKPIVWTYHDLNPIEGIFHYACDKERHPELESLNNQQKTIKKEALSDVKLEVVTPSKWLRECADDSLLTMNSNVHHIPYGIPTEDFYAGDMSEAKKNLGLDTTKKYILFIGDSLDNPRKGFQYFLEIIDRFKSHPGVRFLVVGGGRKVSLPNVITYGRISDLNELRNVYQAAHMTIVTSIEDNLPNVVLESLGCGTPVVAFGVGGIPDLVHEWNTGYLTSLGDTSSMIDGIKRILHDEDLHNNMKKNAAELVRNEHSLKHQASHYLGLYEEVLKLS